MSHFVVTKSGDRTSSKLGDPVCSHFEKLSDAVINAHRKDGNYIWDYNKGNWIKIPSRQIAGTLMQRKSYTEQVAQRYDALYESGKIEYISEDI